MIVPLETLRDWLKQRLELCDHLSLLTARPGPVLLGVLVGADGSVELWETPLDEPRLVSLTPDVPQAHWFERALAEMFGIEIAGHPRFKPLLLHEAWPRQLHPLSNATELRPEYRFLEVEGEGVYEIPVGPIHAGVIEPGHFRFSCLGEIIENLEIRLGYQHRGIERQLQETPWRRGRFLAEAASSDTTVGNALAHALAIEQVCGVEPPPQAVLRRGMALEIERLACHVGDLGGLCGDIGYNGGAAVFGRLRGRALELGERLTGSRFMTAYIAPGGITIDTPTEQFAQMRAGLHALRAELRDALPMMLDNAGVLERMEGIGRVKLSLARSFGLVGPAGRASGLPWDIRRVLHQEPYASLKWDPAPPGDGDVLSRARVRAFEIRESMSLLEQMLDRSDGALLTVPLPDELPSGVGIGIVEAWRGELIHLIATGHHGEIVRYAIKDPSFHNWTGVAIAARGQLVADFPLCNKSFSLSYSGNDL